jgi:hypothetical protein
MRWSLTGRVPASGYSRQSRGELQVSEPRYAVSVLAGDKIACPTSLRGLIKRKLNESFAAGPVIAIPKSQGASVPFDDLAAQYQTYAGAASLSCEKRHKEVLAGAYTRTFVSDRDFETVARNSPHDLNPPSGI